LTQASSGESAGCSAGRILRYTRSGRSARPCTASSRSSGIPETRSLASRYGRMTALRRCSGGAINIPVTSASAGRESLSDEGVPGRGPTRPIAPYHAINYSAEVSLRE
jgi:hypothetical protein